MQVKTLIPALILSLFLSPLSSFAQEEESAYNAKDEAAHFFEKEGYYHAIDLYKKAYGKAKSSEEKAEMIFMVAESYRMLEDYEQAEVWYLRAIKSRYEDPVAFLYLAQALQMQGRYEEAEEELAEYLEKGGDRSKADAATASIEFLKEQNQNPTKYVSIPK